MRFDIVTIFPDMLREVFDFGIVRRARQKDLAQVFVHDLRNWANDPHRSVDDSPYGGGPGMVMKLEPLVSAAEAVLLQDLPCQSRRCVLLSPRGKLLTQSDLRQFSQLEQLVLVAGRYEGVDERFLATADVEEYSIGDYVLSGGEIPAMVVVDAVVRLLPGALSHPESAEEDSFNRGLLDFPHYTRPSVFRGMQVPVVLMSGDHRAVRSWRKEQAIRATQERRPELLRNAVLDEEERAILARIETG